MLSQERVVALLYSKTFPVNVNRSKSGALALDGTGKSSEGISEGISEGNCW